MIRITAVLLDRIYLFTEFSYEHSLQLKVMAERNQSIKNIFEFTNYGF